MKIVATVFDATLSIHVGGPAEMKSAIIEIPDEQVPAIVRQYFTYRNTPGNHLTLSFSLLEEGDSQ